MATIHIVNSTSGMIRVHRAGCRDITKDLRRANSDWKAEVPDGKTVAQAVVDDLNESFGWTPGSEEPQPWHEWDIEVLPCAGEAK